ncbi:MAG: hypothetical protein DWQ04_20990 [Chloroflexi bacterium]|nr:MAG: hypothetical protein DWQ04_20990 [Chloroflexota bacterium]
MKHSSQLQLQRLNLVILGSFILLTLTIVFWSVVRAPSILAREDNPRLVEAELEIRRGNIVDRNGHILAESVIIEDTVSRIYPVPNSGPAVGYYSFRHGTGGVEESFATILRGDTVDAWDAYWRDLLHMPQSGQDIQLTIDARWQQVAAAILGDHKGALLLLTMPADSTIPTAQIIAMSSYPDYDPNKLDEQFDTLVADENSPLLNRTAQGQYQPGLVLQPFIMAAAVDTGQIQLGDVVENVNEPVQVNGRSKQCVEEPVEPTNWRQVLIARCPAAMRQLGNNLGLGGLDQAFASFALTQIPEVPLNTEISDREPLTDPLLAAIGQDTMTITPLQAAVAWMALMTDGRLPTLQLVTAVQDNAGTWQSQSPQVLERETAVSADVAAIFREALSNSDTTISEHNILVLAGPKGNTNGWYLGAMTHENAHYFAIVMIEDTDKVFLAESVGRRVLTAVTRP